MLQEEEYPKERRKKKRASSRLFEEEGILFMSFVSGERSYLRKPIHKKRPHCQTRGLDVKKEKSALLPLSL